jgi:hypothetical protein
MMVFVSQAGTRLGFIVVLRNMIYLTCAQCCSCVFSVEQVVDYRRFTTTPRAHEEDKGF